MDKQFGSVRLQLAGSCWRLVRLPANLPILASPPSPTLNRYWELLLKAVFLALWCQSPLTLSFCKLLRDIMVGCYSYSIWDFPFTQKWTQWGILWRSVIPSVVNSEYPWRSYATQPFLGKPWTMHCPKSAPSRPGVSQSNLYLDGWQHRDAFDREAECHNHQSAVCKISAWCTAWTQGNHKLFH